MIIRRETELAAMYEKRHQQRQQQQQQQKSSVYCTPASSSSSSSTTSSSSHRITSDVCRRLHDIDAPSQRLVCRLTLMNKNFAYISPICRDTSHGRICMKFGTGCCLADIINCARFCLNRVRGFDSVWVDFLAFQ